jgi:hypothetical protein
MIHVLRVRHRLALVAVIVLGVAATSATVAIGSSGQRQTLPDLLTVHNQPGVAAALVDHFSLFRRAPQALPADARGALTTGNLASAFGLDLSRAERVTIGQLTIWVVPGSAGVCEYIQGLATNGISGCGYLQGEYAGSDMFRYISNGGAQTLVGFVPDGNTTVTIQSGGTGTPVPVVDNVFVYSHGSESLHGATVFVRDTAGNSEAYSAP